MHELIEIPAWERLLKKIVWAQLGDIRGKIILDFGSGEERPCEWDGPGMFKMIR